MVEGWRKVRCWGQEEGLTKGKRRGQKNRREDRGNRAGAGIGWEGGPA